MNNIVCSPPVKRITYKGQVAFYTENVKPIEYIAAMQFSPHAVVLRREPDGKQVIIQYPADKIIEEYLEGELPEEPIDLLLRCFKHFVETGSLEEGATQKRRKVVLPNKK